MSDSEDSGSENPYAHLLPAGLRTTTASKVRAERDRLAPVIFSKWNTLRDIVLRHEATIQNRWTRKSKPKRRATLLQAFPDMPKDHLPDVAAWKKKPQNVIIDEKNEDAYLMPYLNLEDLTKTEPLLIMLNARGRHRPDEFAHSDVAAYHVGLVTQSIDRPFLNEYVLMFRGRTDPDTYGQVYHWDDHEDAFFWMHEARGLVPGDGLNCLRIQAKLYDFLIRCCLDILHDIPPGDMVGPNYPVTDEPPRVSATDNDPEAPTSLAVTKFESAYRPPAHLDLDRLETVVAAQVAKLEDDLWSLREDPESFAQTMLEVKEHRQEMLLDTNGNPHPSLNPLRIQVFWDRVVTSALVDKIVSLGVWQVAFDKVVQLRQAMEEHRDQIDPAKDLPEDLAMAFYHLWAALERMEVGPVAILKTIFPASPPMRSHFVRQPPPNPQTTMIQVVSRPISRTKNEQDLLATMRMLWDDKERFLLTTPVLLDMLDNLTRKDSSVHALLSSHVRDQLGHFALISECLRQLKLFQPWSDTFETKMMEAREQIDKDFADRTRWMGPLSQMALKSDFAQLAVPTDGRFRYPAAKKRTKENVEAMRSAEAALDAFWAAFLASYQDTLNPRLREILVERKPQRTPPWAEMQVPEAQPQGKGAIDPSSLAAPFGGLNVQDEESKSKTAAAPRPPKVKTRGVPDPTKTGVETVTTASGNDAAASAAGENSGDNTAPVLRVDRRALKAFQALFFTPDATRQAGETNWSDFLYAMTKVGFSAEKIYGSVWQFRPRFSIFSADGNEEEGKGASNAVRGKPLQVHEPHPSSKIPFWLGRRLGRRLNRMYGWDRSTFVEAWEA
ncbi:hypothetical protein ACRALDRAFT_2114393 [Sodiomyces alcalophilus JCM 7366]|uniref:uncharacterized protein n=1 Tax=Sodiomyces alcalophilus JCM 7366 TaxID=591952 RepID=UPI0039B52D5C